MKDLNLLPSGYESGVQPLHLSALYINITQSIFMKTDEIILIVNIKIKI